MLVRESLYEFNPLRTASIPTLNSSALNAFDPSITFPSFSTWLVAAVALSVMSLNPDDVIAPSACFALFEAATKVYIVFVASSTLMPIATYCAFIEVANSFTWVVSALLNKSTVSFALVLAFSIPSFNC